MEQVWLPFYPFCLQPFDSSTKNKMFFACTLSTRSTIEMIAGLDVGESPAPAPKPTPAAANQNKNKKKNKKKK